MYQVWASPYRIIPHSGLRALRAVRSEQLLGSFGTLQLSAGPKHSTYASPPINLLKSCDWGHFEDLTLQNCFFKWSHMSHMQRKIFKSSNFQTFLETSMDFSWFFVPNCGTLPVKNPCEFIDKIHWGVQSYFQYYAKLANQQNMLQDGVRTSTYNRAIVGKLSFSRKADHGDVLWMGSLKDEKPGKIRKVVATSFEVTWSPKKNHHFFELQSLILDRSSPPKTIRDTNPWATAVSMSSLRWKMSMTFKGSWPWIWVQEVASFPSLPCRWWVHGGDEDPYRTSYKFGTSRGYQALDPIPNDVTKCRLADT